MGPLQAFAIEPNVMSLYHVSERLVWVFGCWVPCLDSLVLWDSRKHPKLQLVHTDCAPMDPRLACPSCESVKDASTCCVLASSPK